MSLSRGSKAVLHILLCLDELIKAGYLSEDLLFEPIIIQNKRRARRALKGFVPTDEEIREFVPQIIDMDKTDDYIWKNLGGRGLS